MNFNTYARHFREGARNIFRNGWMSVAAILAVVVTLFLVGTFIAIIFNINHMTKQVEDDVEIKVLIEVTADKENILTLSEGIEKIEEVDSIVFNSKEEELDELITGFGDEGTVWEMFQEDNNPLNHAYVVKTTNPQETEAVATQIEKMDNVYKVLYGKDVIPKLFNFTKYARAIGLALVIGLVLTAVFLISNTIKLTIMARSQEIGIMKLVGATNSFIRWPFFVEGFILGVIGSIIPIVLIGTGYRYLHVNFSGQTDYEFIQLLPMNPFMWQLSGGIILIGVFIGVWGSIMSVRKFLKV